MSLKKIHWRGTPQCWLVAVGWLALAIWMNYPFKIADYFLIDGVQVSKAEILEDYKIITRAFGWPLPYAEFSIREALPSQLTPLVVYAIADVVFVFSALISVVVFMEKNAQRFSIASVFLITASAACLVTFGQLILNSGSYTFFNIFLIVAYQLPTFWLFWKVLCRIRSER